MAAKESAGKLASGLYRKGICVIGAGNWGTSLATGAVAAGIPLLEVAGRRPSRRPTVAGCAARTLDASRLDAEFVWICVPDGEVAGVAARIAARRGDLRGQTVIHSSGALTVDALEPVTRLGAVAGRRRSDFQLPGA